MRQYWRIGWIVAVLLTGAAFGQTSDGTLSVHIEASQQGVALRVIGILYADEGFRFVVENTGAKPVAEFAVAGILEDAHGCAGVDGLSQLGPNVQIAMIAPHAQFTTETSSRPFAPAHLVFEAGRMGIRDLHVRVVVKNIKFTDGTEWEERPPWEKDRLLPSNGECAANDATVEALRGVRKVGSASPEPTLRGERSLEYTCRISGDMAICP